MRQNLAQLKRRAPSVLLAGLTSTDPTQSIAAGKKLVAEAKEFSLGMQDYLKLACDLSQATPEERARYNGLNGFEVALATLNLPFRDDFEHGVMLQAASDSFQTYPGTRAMFPEVVDQMLRWKNRQDQIETTQRIVAQSRTINGTELISTAVEDDSAERGTSTIAEFGRIPVRTIRTSQTSVGIYKHGSGIRTSYEFERRASLDILTPFAARVARELEISKVKAATAMLINGDTVNPAAPVANFTSFGGTALDASNPLSKAGQYKAIAKWLIQRAKAGTPVDTILGNLDMYIELLFMFNPTIAGNKSEAEAMIAQGSPKINVALPILNSNVEFVLSTSMPANKLLGFSKADTLEELVEAGSTIAENERSIINQAVTYLRTENTGYKLAFGDTREILDLGA